MPVFEQKPLTINRYLTPHLLGFLWGLWLVIGLIMIGFAIMGLVGLQVRSPWFVTPPITTFQGAGTILLTIVGLLITRIWLEFLAIIFSIHDRLCQIRDALLSGGHALSSSAEASRVTPLYGAERRRP